MQVLDNRPTKTNNFWWQRLSRIGVLSFAVWAVALQLGSGNIDPFVTVLALGLISSLRWLKAERRSRVVGFTALAAVTMAINIVFGSSDFRHPESAGSFVPQLFVTVAVALALVGGLGMLTRFDETPARTVLGVGVGVFLGGLMVSLGVSANVVSDSAQPGDVIVVAQGFAWDPVVVSFDRSRHDGLWIDNRDLAHHVLAVTELGIDIDVPSSKAKRAVLKDVPPGEYQMICTLPGHENMTGTLVVSG